MKTDLTLTADGEVLRRGGYDRFESLWSLPREAVDEPNRRGAGWSLVSRHALPGDAGVAGVFYLKRQQDYFPRRGPSRRQLLLREARALHRFAARQVPALEVLAWGSRRADGHHQALLVTRGLEGFRPLDELLGESGGAPDRAATAVAGFAARMHRARLFHGNFYPKHVFVHVGFWNGVADTVDEPVRAIDLEDARWVPLRRYAAVRDLEKLNRYAVGASDFQRLRFLLRYLGKRRFDAAARRLLAGIQRRGRGRRGPDR